MWISEGKENENALVEFIATQISNIWTGVGHCEIGHHHFTEIQFSLSYISFDFYKGSIGLTKMNQWMVQVNGSTRKRVCIHYISRWTFKYVTGFLAYLLVFLIFSWWWYTDPETFEKFTPSSKFPPLWCYELGKLALHWPHNTCPMMILMIKDEEKN